MSRIQENSTVLLRNFSLNSGNDISPGEGFAVSEFATETFDKAVVDGLSAVSQKNRSSSGMVRSGLSSEQAKKQEFLINGERNSSSKLTASRRLKTKKFSFPSFYHIGTIGDTVKILYRTTEVYFLHFHWAKN